MRVDVGARGNAPCHEAAANLSAFQRTCSSYAARPLSVTGRPSTLQRGQGCVVAQRLPQANVPAVSPHLDRAHTRTHHLRDLRELEPVEPMQLDDLALIGGQ